MSIATLSSKYQISIPKDVREALHLKPAYCLFAYGFDVEAGSCTQY